MLSSQKLKHKHGPGHSLILTVLFLLLLNACVPQSQAPGVNSGNSTNSNSGTTDGAVPLYEEPAFPLTGTFIQEGSTRTTTNFPLPVNFTDSFLLRGLELSKYLRKLPNTTKFCLVGKYTHVPGSDKFLVMAAKPRSYTDLINKTTEFYLQVEPANDQANQNDCLTYNLSNTLLNSGTSPALQFSLTQLCTNCTTTITSTPLKLFFNNGEEVPKLPLGGLLITVAGSTASSTNSCVESTLCKARGFDCCLAGQCVKDGAVKPDALTKPEFMAAQEDVRVNPDRFVVYPQFYFVCESRPDSTGTNNPPYQGDPNYEASIRLLELTQLYQCLNLVDGEFSYCTVKFAEASKKIPGNFSITTLGIKDDVNFSTLNYNFASNDYKNNIVKVSYGGKVLYELNKTPLTDASFVAGTENDDLFSAQYVNVTSALPSNALDDNLYLTYKIDGTCERVGSLLAKCHKTYIQTSSETTATTWHDSSKVFYLPHYADVSASASVIVKVGGIVVPEEASTWVKAPTPNRITFNPTYQLFQNQKIEITYFVSSNVDELMKSKSSAQAKVNSMCACSGTSKCNLKPLLNETKQIVNFECTYPEAQADTAPANQTVYVSSKNVPHRYFDVNGVLYDGDYGSALDQEGNLFKYTNNDTLKPNNLSAYVGFNEIYGSFTKSPTFVSKPAKYARVKKDQLYDIIVSSGVFSSCTSCGSDYYTSLQKIFPQNFAGNGGGYTPNYYETGRDTNTSIYRSDDLLYGRACFVPATMIPWTHLTAGDPKDQRKHRLAAQHFLHANGYTRDWYGFDYGSIIGSFDGVSWFSVGNQRRIKATSNKLYLAVNAYFGDLSLDNNFNVTVSESSIFSSPIPTHDSESDGAECQRAHYCNTDKDCITNLGYDYTCQNVSGILTSWPTFDVNGSEVVGTITKTLASIVGGSNGQSKRCVYRGRGAPCHRDLSSTGTTFNGSTLVGTLACSPNNVCLQTSASGFNDKIARFANSPLAQNVAEVVLPAGDTLGLGAKIIGRPYNYYGTSDVPNLALPGLDANNVKAVCVPGKDLVNSTTNYHLNNKVPASRPGTSDKILGIGTTTTGNPRQHTFLTSCPATNDLGNYVHLINANVMDGNVETYIRSQNLSTAQLAFTSLINAGLFNTSGNSQVTKIGYHPNACLRAAGASCYSDMDCGPSPFIASKVKTSITSEMNEAEKKFWEEELVCGNPDYEVVDGGLKNPLFDNKKNRCCREFGKVLTVYTETDSSDWEWCQNSPSEASAPKKPIISGNTVEHSSTRRYSRVHTGYDKFTCDLATANQTVGSNIYNNNPGLPYALSMKGSAVERWSKLQTYQFKTLDTINSRTCCTEHWVRSFNKEENGGGHAFDKAKMQTVNVEMFKHISWFTQNTTLGVTDTPFHCKDDGINHATGACEVRSFTDAEAEKYLKFGGSLELIGIPQVAVMTNDQIFKIVDDDQEDTVASAQGYKPPLSHTIKDVSTNAADFEDSTTNLKYFSGTSYSKFDIGTNKLKKVFSESEFNCCIPTGKQVPETVTGEQCCTGLVANVGGPRRCCLPDFADVTVYLNRYVSSQGRGLPDNAYDATTGYIKDPGMVRQIASQNSICCSGQTVFGSVLGYLHIPLKNDSGDEVYIPGSNAITQSRRFHYRTDAIDNNPDTGFIGDKFTIGLRWNNHVYCVPQGFGD